MKIVILILITTYISTGFNKLEQVTKVDSLKTELRNKTKEEQIAIQLDLALNIIKKENLEAQKLAKSAYLASQKTENKFLKMRSSYVMGRVMIDKDSLKTSQKYYNKALLLSEEIEDNWYIGEILFRKASNEYNLNETQKALITYNKALNFCRLSDNFKIIGAIYAMTGTIFRNNGLYDRAIEHFIKSKLNYEKVDFIEGNAWVAYLLGQVYLDFRRSEKAMEYFQESLDIYLALASIDGNSYGVALCYEQIVLINLKFENFDEASKNINTLLKIHKEDNSHYASSFAYSLLGKSEYLQGNYSQAEIYLNKSLKTIKGYDNLHIKSTIYEYLGLCLIKKGAIDEGIKKIKKGLEIAIENKDQKNILEIYLKLAEIYLNSNNLEKVVFFKNKIIEIQDENLFGDADTKIEQFQAFYEIDEKNREILELENQNEINTLKIKQSRNFQILMGLIILVALFIIITTSLFYYKIRHKNKELEILNSTKNKIFSIISHDLRGPIGSANGLFEILTAAMKNKNMAQFEKIVPVIHKSLNETVCLIDNLLLWSKSQINGMKFSREFQLLSKTLNSTIKSISNQSEKKSIIINVDVDESVNVFADKNMLEIILRNLLTNAIKFTNKHGKIKISAIKTNNFIKVCIKDSGTGISSDTLKKLFSNKTVVSKLGTSNEKGTGLGLIICKDLVKLHKGQIWAESTINEGSSFYFTIPIKK